MLKTALCFLSVSLAMAQHHGPSSEQSVALYKGLGTWHHSIHTNSAGAQKFFDQGLALLYGFNRYESLRSFRKAAELDKNAAMAYWGMAMAQGPYVNMDGDTELNMKASCAAVEAGLKLTGAPERERAYLQAAARRCPEYQPQAYTDAMRALAMRWPDDLDAATLYAESLLVPVRWHWYGADGAPAPGVAEAERTLEGVLRRWPDHPGANHYYIHAVESSPNPERGIASAQRLMPRRGAGQTKCENRLSAPAPPLRSGCSHPRDRRRSAWPRRRPLGIPASRAGSPESPAPRSRRSRSHRDRHGRSFRLCRTAHWPDLRR